MSKRVISLAATVLALTIIIVGFRVYGTSLAAPLHIAREKIFTEKRSKPIIVDIGEFITNLDDSYGRGFIRTSINLELADKKNIPDLKSKMPLIRDTILKVLRSKTGKDVAGDEGMKALAADILERLIILVPDDDIVGVYFLDFAVQ